MTLPKTRVERRDFGEVTGVERTPSGGLKIPARLTRTGIFKYKRADGTTVRELRPAEEVFHSDSLATLAGAAVTNLHPSQPVRPTNWKQVSVGHVSESITPEDKYVSAPLFIQDADTIMAIESGKRRELSCGYSCRVDATPGEYEGERYDQVQRDIRYNHVAIGPVGWGRAGSEVAIRLDDNGNQLDEQEERKMKYTIDGVTYDTSSPELEQAMTLRDKRLDAERAQLTTERDRANAERDAANKAAEDAKKLVAEAQDPARLDSLVEKRAGIVEAVRRVLGKEYVVTGKTDRQLMVDVIRHDNKTFDDKDRSDDYVTAYYEARADVRSDSNVGDVRAAHVNARRSDERTDSTENRDDKHDPEAARRRMVDSNTNAAAEPLRFSRKD